jgi:hypothetical protein
MLMQIEQTIEIKASFLVKQFFFNIIMTIITSGCGYATGTKIDTNNILNIPNQICMLMAK